MITILINYMTLDNIYKAGFSVELSTSAFAEWEIFIKPGQGVK